MSSTTIKVGNTSRWWLIVSPDRDWSYPPTLADTPEEAVESSDEEWTKDDSSYLIYELASSDPIALNTKPRLVPA